MFHPARCQGRRKCRHEPGLTEICALIEKFLSEHVAVTDYARQQLLTGRVIVHQTRQLDHAAYDQLRRSARDFLGRAMGIAPFSDRGEINGRPSSSTT